MWTDGKWSQLLKLLSPIRALPLVTQSRSIMKFAGPVSPALLWSATTFHLRHQHLPVCISNYYHIVSLDGSSGSHDGCSRGSMGNVFSFTSCSIFLQVCSRLAQQKLSYPLQTLDNMGCIPRGAISTGMGIIKHTWKVNKACSHWTSNPSYIAEHRC